MESRIQAAHRVLVRTRLKPERQTRTISRSPFGLEFWRPLLRAHQTTQPTRRAQTLWSRKQRAMNRRRIRLIRPRGVPENAIQFVLRREVILREVHPARFA